MRAVRISSPSLLVVLLLAVATSASLAQTQSNISQAAATTCAVMSGQRKADSQAFKYLLLVDEDIGDANPVALALHREVVKQCPKAYLDYEQRKRGSNPFPAGSLVKSTPTQLVNPEPDYPIRCRGAHGLASTDGKNLVVDFRKGAGPADKALQPGQCSWLDRGVRPNEPTRITDECATVTEARNTSELINAGETWTFWVMNTGTFFKATASAKGKPNQKP